MFPYRGFNVSEALRESGFNSLVMPEVFYDFQYRIDARRLSFCFPFRGVRRISPCAKVRDNGKCQ